MTTIEKHSRYWTENWTSQIKIYLFSGLVLYFAKRNQNEMKPKRNETKTGNETEPTATVF